MSKKRENWVFTLFILLQFLNSTFPRIVDSSLPDFDSGIVLNTSNHNLVRFRRASQADKLSPIVHNFQSLARITNGISLEIGLTDGSIPSDDVVSEFLHMGSLKPSAVESIDSTKVSEVMIGFEKLNEGLVAVDKLTVIEERLKELNAAKEKFLSMRGYAELNGKKVYVEHLKKVKEMSQLRIDLLKISIDDLSSVFKFIKHIQITEKNAPNLMIQLKKFPGGISDFEIKWKNFRERKVHLFPTLKETESKSSFFRIFKTEWELRSEILTSKKLLHDTSPLDTNVAAFSEIGAKVQKSLPALSRIQDFTLTRDPSHHQNPKYVSGFPNGFKDFDSLPRDISNPWITKRVEKSDIVMKSLAKVFKSFDGLKKELKGVEGAWKGIDDKEKLKSVQDRISELKILAEFAPKSAEISKFITDVKACEKMQEKLKLPDADIKILNDELKAITDLNTNIENVSVFEDFSEVPDFGNILSTITALTDEDLKNWKKIEETVKKIRGLEEFTAGLRIFEKLQPELEVTIKAVDDVEAMIAAIKFDEIDKYHTATSGDDYLKVYTCFADIGDRYTIYDELKAKISEYKNPPNQKETDDVNSFIQSFDASKKNLKSLTTAVEGIKNSKSTDIEFVALINSFPNSQEVSLNIGKAVSGLVTIRKLLEQKDDINKFLEKIDEIVADSETSSIKQESKDRLKMLPDFKSQFLNSFSAIDEFLKSLEDMQTSRKKRATRETDFVSLSKIFEAVGRIPGVTNSDMKGLQEALNELHLILSDKYVDESQLLESLRGLHLDFSSIKYADATSSLSSIDVSFLAYVNGMLPPPKSTPEPSVTPNPELPENPGPKKIANLGIKQEKDGINFPYGAIGIVISICVAVLVFAVFIILCCSVVEIKKIDQDSRYSGSLEEGVKREEKKPSKHPKKGDKAKPKTPKSEASSNVRAPKKTPEVSKTPEIVKSQRLTPKSGITMESVSPDPVQQQDALSSSLSAVKPIPKSWLHKLGCWRIVLIVLALIGDTVFWFGFGYFVHDKKSRKVDRKEEKKPSKYSKESVNWKPNTPKSEASRSPKKTPEVSKTPEFVKSQFDSEWLCDSLFICVLTESLNKLLWRTCSED